MSDDEESALPPRPPDFLVPAQTMQALIAYFARDEKVQLFVQLTNECRPVPAPPRPGGLAGDDEP